MKEDACLLLVGRGNKEKELRQLIHDLQLEDKARLLHKGSASDLTLTSIKRLASYGASGSAAQGTGGKPCALVFSGKNLFCEAGDLIVKD